VLFLSVFLCLEEPQISLFAFSFGPTDAPIRRILWDQISLFAFSFGPTDAPIRRILWDQISLFAKFGGADGARTRDLRIDSPTF
jgi:hypothetical protein